MVRILGVDPGLTRCGLGVIEVDARRNCKLVEVSVATSAPSQELSVRIGTLAESIEACILRTSPERIALERVFAQANLRSVMGVAQISGVVLWLAHKYGLPITFHTPSEVKSAVTGNGRAQKPQVGSMVVKVLGLQEVPKPADAADALAIAITSAWKNQFLTTEGEPTKAQIAWQKAQAAAGNSNRNK